MTLTAGDLMEKDVWTVWPDMRLADLERKLIERGVSGAPVVRDGRVVGVVSRSDVVAQVSIGRTLADVALSYYRDAGIAAQMGDIEPEDDEKAAEIVRHRLETTSVEAVMTELLVAVAPEASVDRVAQTMVEWDVHRVLVLDGERLVGIISSLDFVRLFADGRATAATGEGG